MAVNGKNKGNSFERKVSQIFSKRFEHYTGISQSFRRNPDSGSFFGASNQSRKETHDLDYAVFGDLICPRNFNFSIECKSYKTPPSFNAIVKQKVTDWDTWLKQAAQDAENSKKKMMLIMKFNSVEETVFLDFVPEGLAPTVQYKNYYLFTLQEILGLVDNFFFTK